VAIGYVVDSGPQGSTVLQEWLLQIGNTILRPIRTEFRRATKGM